MYYLQHRCCWIKGVAPAVLCTTPVTAFPAKMESSSSYSKLTFSSHDIDLQNGRVNNTLGLYFAEDGWVPTTDCAVV